MARQSAKAVRWVEEPEDPELEARLLQELEWRRQARRDARRQAMADRRSRRLFWLSVVVLLALVSLIGYGLFALARSLFL